MGFIMNPYRYSVGGYEVGYSCRFNDDDSADLYQASWSTPGSDKKFTFSTWFKYGNIEESNIFTSTASSGGGTNFTTLQLTSTGQLRLTRQSGGSVVFDLKTNQLLRDPSAWYHIHVVYDSTPSTPGANDCYFSINGVKVTSLATSTYPSQDVIHDYTRIDPTYTTDLGVLLVGGGLYLDGYLSQTIYLDNQKLAATSFGEFDDNGVWRPINCSTLTFADNSFFLDYANSSAFGNDVSGENNDFTDRNFATNDQVIDTPTDNYCVMSPITGLTDTTLSDGNLAISSASDEDYILSSVAIDVADSNGWYFEFEETANNASSQMGVATMTLVQDDASPGNDADTYMFELSGGGRQLGSASYQNNATWDSGTNGEIAEDAYGVMAIKGGHIWAGVVADGGGTITWYNGATKAEIEAGTTTNAMTTGALSGLHWISWTHSGTATATGQFNFGQHAFQGSDIPSGLKKISTSQLPAPAIADGTAHFQPTIYTGNGTAIGSGGLEVNQSGNSTFQPDFTWIKNRDTTDSHMLFDSERGATKDLNTDNTSAEVTDTESLSTFDADGFTVGSNVAVNTSAEDYVAWQWLESVTNGFKVRLVPNAEVSASSTFAHGNTAGKPEFVITKQVDDVQSWYTWHTGVPENDYFTMETNGAVATGDTVFTAFDATNVSTGSFSEWNDATDFLCLSWVGIEGYSQFGTYEGNNNADGPVVYTGFSPAWVCCKNIDSAVGGNWWTVDSARDTINPADKELILDGTSAEDTDSSAVMLDFLSNGFKMRSAGSAANSANTFLYMAFAEHPFGGSGVSPATAR